MNFTVGYQYPDEGGESRFPEIVKDYRPLVDEVYFAAGNDPGARSPAALASGLEEDEAGKILLEDLLELKHSGVRLNLLLNANCYGTSCISVALAKQVLDRAAFFWNGDCWML